MIELDLKGLSCPMPLLKAKLALNGLNTDDVVAVWATDPGSQRDFAVFCEQSGHQLLESSEQNGNFYYRIQKS